MEPTDALRAIENGLRLVIRDQLGVDGWSKALGAPDLERLEARRVEETKRRDGVAVSDDLLNFTETYHLTALVEKNWERFKPVFDDRARTLTYFGIIKDLRNSIAHSRELVPFERDLMSGIAGHLRSQISLFRSGQNESTRYYPLIETVCDSFGNEGAARTQGGQRRVRLEVGQQLQFSGSAFSARGKTVKWFLARDLNHWMIGNDEVAAGDDVTFTYTISEEDVSEALLVTIYVVAESRFHRNQSIPFGGYDDSRLFMYAVNPPDED
ncbi:hypothetical protein [Actinophytocola sp.]|uniref:hypothetical protein n=1 Tax=Actinophytocola sp. TaxID=1872138 RepID=UPI003D6A8665